ncbi:MAG: PKD domain-containing protein [Bacteroidia bacterium]
MLFASQDVKSQLSSCVNADFEMNSFANWTGTSGFCCPINSITPGIVAGRHTIMTGPGTDPNTNGAITVVAPGGQSSARLGNDDVGSEAEQLSYQIAVDATNALFIYRYAVVLEDPSHTLAEQPRFEIRVYDQNGLPVVCGDYNVVASSGIPGFVSIVNSSGSTVHYKDWTTVGINLSPYIGQNVTIEFSTGDCALGGHYGYAYVDCYCSPLIILSDLCAGANSTILTAPIGFESYAWSTGETTQSITINNVVIGTQYQCTMTSVTGCTITLTTILTPTILAPHFGQITNCQNQTRFQDSSLVTVGTPINVWKWDFGDGQTSNVQHPTHNYTAPGNYNVSLTVTNMGGCADTVDYNITTIPIPLVDFNSPPVCPNDVSSFFDASGSSNGPLVKWNWNFGDGATDTLPNPMHTYSLPGTYPVTLIITDSLGCKDTLIKNVSTLPGPVSDFSYLSACVSSQINFTDVSSVVGTTISDWEWNFGDASPLVTGISNPNHFYPGPGTYNTSLIVTTANGCKDTIVEPVDVQSVPIAGFNNALVCANQYTQFTDASVTNVGTIIGWQWSFGDGSQAALTQNPTHTFPPGNYNVQLVVTGSNGCTDTHIQNINVLDGPVANFSSTPVCPGSSSTFSDLSLSGTGTINSWEWNFGDGSPLTNVVNPQHTFTGAGSYAVSLVVESTNGCADTTTISIATNPIPNADYFIPTGCVNAPLFFPNQSNITIGGIASYEWNFDDGSPLSTQSSPTHLFSAAGSYFVSLVAISNLGCRDSIVHEVIVVDLPQANFSVSDICLGDSAIFTDISFNNQGSILDWQWNYGDGSLVTFGIPQTNHSYAAIGPYSPSLIVMNSAGCFDTIQKTIVVKELPIPSFSTTGPYCVGSYFSLANTSTLNGGAIQSQQWTNSIFGMYTSPNPQVVFSQAGNHLINLVVTGTNGCVDSTNRNVFVNNLPTADMTLQNVCELDNSLFLDQSVSGVPISTWTWTFGDGDSSFIKNPIHTYASDGTYAVTHQVVDANGCKKDTAMNIVIFPKPFPQFTTNNECVGISFSFLNTSTIPNGYFISNSSWNFGDGSPLDTNFHPNHIYQTSGNYLVTYVAASDRGCRDTIADSIIVYPLPNVSFISDTVCEGNLSSLFNTSTIVKGNIVGYNWNFGDQSTSTQTNPSHIYPTGGNHPTTLVATSDQGCIDSLTRNVRVWWLPQPLLQADIVEGCEPLPVFFLDLSTSQDGSIVNWNWDLGNGDTSSLEHPSTIYEEDGLYDVRLNVISSLGCINDTTYSDYVLVHPLPIASFRYDPSEPSVFIPLVYFYDQSALATVWHWNFGDTTYSSVQDPTHKYKNPGIYPVQLIVESEFGCLDTAWDVIEIKKDYAIWIPSAFTPNGDGYNETFMVKGFGFSQFTMQIFNRWGALIFTSNEVIKGWDGTYQGEDAQQEVYVYKIDMKDDLGNPHTYTGRVTIIR